MRKHLEQIKAQIRSRVPRFRRFVHLQCSLASNVCVRWVNNRLRILVPPMTFRITTPASRAYCRNTTTDYLNVYTIWSYLCQKKVNKRNSPAISKTAILLRIFSTARSEKDIILLFLIDNTRRRGMWLKGEPCTPHILLSSNLSSTCNNSVSHHIFAFVENWPAIPFFPNWHWRQTQ